VPYSTLLNAMPEQAWKQTGLGSNTRLGAAALRRSVAVAVWSLPRASILALSVTRNYATTWKVSTLNSSQGIGTIAAVSLYDWRGRSTPTRLGARRG
jgi:hypothetical protein